VRCVVGPSLLVGFACLLACGETVAKPRTAAHKPAEARTAHIAILPNAPIAKGPTPPPVPAKTSLAIHELTIEGLTPLIERAIQRGELPGCVVAVGDRAGIRFLDAFGERTKGEPMTVDTRFDLASITKAVATSASIMSLVEAKRLKLDEPAATVLAELRTKDKRRLPLSWLLLHTSGLPSVNVLDDTEHGVPHAIAEIAKEPLSGAPGADFRYSDLGFILLGEVVARSSGQSLASYAEEHVFRPLGMHDTRFVPPASEAWRTAPTEERDEQVIRGVVDDPRAYRLGGVAGHAGLFSTASDLARFARMILGEGELDGARVLKAETVRTWIAPHPIGRAFGFDMASSYSDGKGTLFSARAIGHGGYTGTSLWIDPERDLFVVLLSNRVHVGPKGTIHPLARNIADLAARASELEGTPAAGLQTGIDVLEGEAFARLRGPGIALLTHEAARDRHGKSTLEVLTHEPGVFVRKILSPEHGLLSNHEGHVADSSYEGIAVHSLFGKHKRPNEQALAGVELVVIDLVDVGARFYTYMATALATLEAASRAHIPVIVLDRPNPIDGVHVEGPISEPAYASFVNYHPLPLRHGMTAGELLRFLVRARNLDVELEIVRMRGYRRDMLFKDTALTWRAPSPNLRRPEQALLYPAVALVEGTNVSVGRGTTQAFEMLGAPFIDAKRLQELLTAEHVPGVRISTARFTPSVGPHAGTRLVGVHFEVREPREFQAAPLGLAIVRALRELAPDAWDQTRLDRMLAHAATLAALRAHTPTSELISSWQADLETFAISRNQALLY